MRLAVLLLVLRYVSRGSAFTPLNSRTSRTTSSSFTSFSSIGNRRYVSYLFSSTKTSENKVMKDLETVPVGSDEGIILISNIEEVEVDGLKNMSRDISEFFPTLGLLWVVALLSALDRVAMSVAILPLSTEYHLTDTIKGQISSIFSVGYGIGILPFGLLVASVSPRLIMGIGVTLWSLATFGTPIAASLIQLSEIRNSAESLSLNPEVTVATTIFVAANVAPLLLTRAIMGAAESVVLPATQRLLANWVPASMKSIAVATVISGFQFGTVSAYLLSPWVMDNCGGWRGLFFVYGAVGAFWLVPWTIFSRDYPATSVKDSAVECATDGTAVLVNTMSDDDASLVMEGRCLDENGNSIPVFINGAGRNSWDEAVELFRDAPWASFSKSSAVWAMILAHAANNWGLYNMLSWTPTFYAEQYGLNVRESAFLSVFPSIAGAICGLSAGFIADNIISSLDSSSSTSSEGESNKVSVRTSVRKAFQGLALLGPAACLIALSSNIPEDPLTAQALLMGTVGLQAFNAAGYGSSPQEKAGEKWSGLLYSITTLPGVIFGSLGV